MIALSWSRLSDYMQCARKFHLKYVQKAFREEEKSVHLVKGEQLHRQLENYVLAKNGHAEMPLGFSPEVKGALPYVDKVIASYQQVHPEAQIAATKDWRPAEWFGSDVGWRAIWDLTALRTETCFIGDYKSGKVYDYGSGYGQLHLSAVIALNRFHDVPEVNAAYIYIEHQKVFPIKVTRENLPKVQEHFDKKFDEVQREVNWDPKINEFCKFCPATRAQCPYSRKL